MRTTKELPAVDVDLFRKFFNIFYEAVRGAKPEDRETDWVFALFHAVPRKDYMAVCSRIAMLDDVIHNHRAQVIEHKGFPGNWVDTAATAPLVFGKQFEPALFPWVTESA